MSHSKLGAGILILVGAVFLLINLGIMPAAELKALLAKWWPLILIVVGAWLLFQRRPK
jgi:lipopolysaccharide export LptBFGC system permease protein LptF